MHIVGCDSFHRKKYCISLDQHESNPEFPSCHVGEKVNLSYYWAFPLYPGLYKVSRALIIVEIPGITSNYLVVCPHWFTAEIPFCAIFPSGLRTPIFLTTLRTQESGIKWVNLAPPAPRCSLPFWGFVTEQDRSLRCSLNLWASIS